MLVLWFVMIAVSFAHFRLLSIRIFVVTLAPFVELVRSSLFIEPSEEVYVQAESMIEEEQEPAYLAEPGKHLPKPLLCPIILQSMFCFQK